jgi:hypothetical protein
MRNLLALLAAAGITFAGAGWYLGWYHVEKAPASEGHRAVHIDIDNDKISADLKKGGEKVQGVLDNRINGVMPSDTASKTPSPQQPVSSDELPQE